MNVSGVIVVLFILAVSTMPALAPENRGETIRKKIELYVRALAFWSVVITLMSWASYALTTSPTSKGTFRAIIQTGVIIAIPSLSLAFAMWKVERKTSPKVLKRELELNR